MQRLSALDASFLHLENADVQANIGGVSVFEGPAPKQAEVLRRIEAKLAQVPRYRQRVHTLPGHLAAPLWVDDAHFNLGYHVRRTALPKPGDEAELRTLFGRVISQHLDDSKPLWELWVVEGLRGGRWAVLWKVHHAMVDGISAGDLMGALLDVRPDDDPGEPQPWTPSPEPTKREILGEVVRSAVNPLRRLGELPAASRDPRGLVVRVLGGVRSLLPLGGALKPNRGPLNGPIGPHRRWATISVPLEDVKSIRKQHGGTVNDVVLAVVTAGLRALLTSRGESLDDLTVRTFVPVSMRAPDARGVHGNQVAGLVAELPVSVPDAVERLNRISRQMDELKRSGQALAASAIVSLADFAPPMLLALGGRTSLLMSGQTAVQTVTTNVPGPQHPLYFAGRRMVALMPYLMLGPGVRVATSIFSYDGTLCFGVTADYDSTPDIDVMTSGIAGGVAELLAAPTEER